MPLEPELRDRISVYCQKDLPGDLQWHIDQVDFLDDAELRQRVGRAFYSARYVSKLLEALYLSGDQAHALVKFQVTQYASIFEAVISFLLFKRYAANAEVIRLQTHRALRRVAALGHLTNITYGDEVVYTCVERDAKTTTSSISFGDKVDCAVRIGFVDSAYADDIKRIYQLRNLLHIENEADKKIEVEISDARQGYWRMKPFLETVKRHIAEETP
jgi:hypothetical protein